MVLEAERAQTPEWLRPRPETEAPIVQPARRRRTPKTAMRVVDPFRAAQCRRDPVEAD